MKPALILIDIQNDYFAGGAMELSGMQTAATNAQKLLANFRNLGLPIFHIQHLSQRANANFFLPNTVGAEIHALVQPLAGETVIHKHYPNSFRDTPLQEKLREKDITTLVICGAMSHICVDSTTRAAFDYGYRNIVIHDACASRDLSFNEERIAAQQVHYGFMAALNGIFAEVISLDQYLRNS